MAISKIKSGKFAGLYRVRIQPKDKLTGKVIRVKSQVTKTSDYLEAQKLESKMWSDFHGQQLVVETKLDQPLADEFQRYVDESQDLGKWSSSTAYDWQYTAKLVKHYFGRQKIRDIQEMDVNKFAHQYVREHKTKVAKHSTVDRQLQNLRCFFGKMERYGLKINPVPKGALLEFFRRGDMTRPDEKYIFSDNEICQIRQQIYQDLGNKPFNTWGTRLGILIALDTGMRPQEIQALRWNEFLDEEGFKVFEIHDSWNERTHELNLTLKDRMQGDTRKTLPLSDRTYHFLHEYHHKQSEYLKRKGIRNKNNFVLLTLGDIVRCTAGYPIAQRSLNDMLKSITKKLKIDDHGLGITMYTCRHTVASKLGNNPQMSYPWAAARLGHTLEMFMRTYVHPDEDKNKSMLKLVVSSKTH
ncbi:tyrosine-type recombinase/integrase [Limosilactobacillus oris]|uniref:tyrosine-type recombinase/integrase n=1 Tax=Limosilactobacillus oris TaxID=1632 RepID=UPI0018841120|nr:tyrosine-type recombinase/integrase [Limosilactobacillus oris]MBF0601524.1 tyrosine-type recombinase/integrase [Limosilactobacillus oris]